MARASCLSHLGQIEPSIDQLKQAIEILSREGLTKLEAEAHSELGRLYTQLGDTAKANEHLVRSVELFKSIAASR